MALPALPDPNPNGGRFVQSQAVTQIAQLDVFGGAAAGGATVEIAGAPTLTATASGLPGGAHVTYGSPIVTINGNTVLDASTLGGAFTQLLDGLKPLLGGAAPLITIEASAGDLTNVVEAADGTAASADAVLVHLKVNLLPAAGGDGVTLFDLDLGPMHAEAFAPAGGISCGGPQPLQVVKDAPATVKAGDSFTQTITVTNTEPVCTLAAVKVTDLITGPAGSSVTSTDPTADAISGSPEAGGISVTWNDIGDIGPGQSKVLTVVVKTDPDTPNGAKFHDDATASGTCDGSPRDGAASLDRPVVTNDLVRADTLPRTGGNDTMLLLAGAVLIGLALGVRRLRLA
jgi:LPXTG-motif cell wall-anchored protein